MQACEPHGICALAVPVLAILCGVIDEIASLLPSSHRLQFLVREPGTRFSPASSIRRKQGADLRFDAAAKRYSSA